LLYFSKARMDIMDCRTVFVKHGFIISHCEIQQVPLIKETTNLESDILKLADFHGFIGQKSINKEFGIPEDEAKKEKKC